MLHFYLLALVISVIRREDRELPSLLSHGVPTYLN